MPNYQLLRIFVTLGTFPYYRIFHFNTLRPIQLIAFYTSHPQQYYKLLYHLDRWRTRKLAELQYISIACAILAGATIGSFSWNAVSDAYWLTAALWYSSLVISILGILQSAQQTAVLHLLGQIPTRVADTSSNKSQIRRYLPLMMSEVLEHRSTVEGLGDGVTIGEWKPRWKMIFIWQCPIMFMSYSVLFFLAGLTIFVCTPLIRWKGWNTGSNVAVVYLATTMVALAIFTFCSFWIYHYIDLEHGSGDITELENETPTLMYT